MVMGRIINFRELCDKDKLALQIFLNDLSKETFNEWRRYSENSVEKIYKEVSHKLIAISEEKIMAFGCLIPDNNYPDIPSLGIVVADEYRNIGMGSVMMNQLEELAIKNCYKFIFLKTFKSNHHAYNLYKKMGYEVIDEIEHYGLPAYAMKKSLGEK